MYFLIGVILLILFVFIIIFYFRYKVKSFLASFGFSNLMDIVSQAKLDEAERPKSLSSMDRIYLEQIKQDFPSLNILELKRAAEKVILDCYLSIEKKDTSSLKGKIKSYAESIINNYSTKNIHFDFIKIHNTVVSNYKKEKGVATISFSTAFEYYLVEDNESKKIQDRVRTEFIYVIDASSIDSSIHALGIHCPNCGSPITSLGEKTCSYCGGAVIELIGRVFTCNDIVRY